MPRLRMLVDFNAVRDGLVRGLMSELDGTGEVVTGERILLDDGEGMRALGVIADITDDLIFAGVIDYGYAVQPATITETQEPERNPKLLGVQIQGAERQLVPA